MSNLNDFLPGVSTSNSFVVGSQGSPTSGSQTIDMNGYDFCEIFYEDPDANAKTITLNNCKQGLTVLYLKKTVMGSGHNPMTQVIVNGTTLFNLQIQSTSGVKTLMILNSGNVVWNFNASSNGTIYA